MTRHVITIRTDADRAKVINWVRNCAAGYRVEVKEPKRTDLQNDRQWGMLSDVAKTATINGKRYDPDQWKCVFMRAMGKEVKFLPTLDGQDFFPVGFRSSDLSVREMSDLQEFISAWAAENAVPLPSVGIP